MGFVEAKWAADNIVKEVFFATITVNTNEGANVTFTKGSFSETVACPTGTCIYKVHELGEWTVKAEKSGVSETNKVIVNGWGSNSVVKIRPLGVYGISRNTNNPSTAWTRTDDSVGLTATASVGTQAGRSDFDDCYPWSEMKRQTIGSDLMVKIPEFWFKRYVQGGTEYIKIADKQTEGFTKHPGSGRFVGAYKTSNNNRSVKNAAPTVNQTRATMRNNAKSKGSGWGIIDLMTWNAIQTLYLVEFADNDSQKKVGRGYCDSSNSFALSSGSCDNVPGLTGRPAGTDGKVDVVYRGIEGIWGNIYEWVDGLNVRNGEYYICLDQSKYADDTSSNYHKLGYRGLTGDNWITAEGMDNNYPWAMLPSAANGGSGSTYYADYVRASTGGWYAGFCSGNWKYGGLCGLFLIFLYDSSSYTNSNVGSRLLYKPS